MAADWECKWGRVHLFSEKRIQRTEDVKEGERFENIIEGGNRIAVP
jgi:hypothetical protein